MLNLRLGAPGKHEMLEEGDIIEINNGHTVYTDIPEHFAFSNRKGVFNKTIHTKVVIGGEFSYLAGRYVVYKTSRDGGGSGTGPSDVYPDGHHVFCERLEDRLKVDFYQSGSFTAMIEAIDPVGHAVRQWVELPDGGDETPS